MFPKIYLQSISKFFIFFVTTCLYRNHYLIMWYCQNSTLNLLWNLQEGWIPNLKKKIDLVFSIKQSDEKNLLWARIWWIKLVQELVASWKATCARKPKVPTSNPAASYVQRRPLSSVVTQVMSKCLWSGWKWKWGLKEMVSLFLRSSSGIK